MKLITRYYRCTECKERWAFSYDVASILWGYHQVMAVKAEIEFEVASHRVECVNARVEGVLNG